MVVDHELHLQNLQIKHIPKLLLPRKSVLSNLRNYLQFLEIYIFLKLILYIKKIQFFVSSSQQPRRRICMRFYTPLEQEEFGKESLEKFWETISGLCKRWKKNCRKMYGGFRWENECDDFMRNSAVRKNSPLQEEGEGLHLKGKKQKTKKTQKKPEKKTDEPFKLNGVTVVV